MSNLKTYALLAKEILSDETSYSQNKKIITDIFKLSKDNIDKVFLRLTVIDNFYSTQMSKRIFGIEEIGKTPFIKQDDEVLKNLILDYLENTNENDHIVKFLNDSYGYNKVGSKYGIASSLISKYFYFITNYKFPIYDNLVQDSYKEISKRYPLFELPDLPLTCNSHYFESFKKLNQVTGINDFDLLDNLLWLLGKIRKGSLSLILKQDTYLSLVKNNISFGNSLKSKEIDKIVCEYLQNKQNEDTLSAHLSHGLIKFIRFCFNN